MADTTYIDILETTTPLYTAIIRTERGERVKGSQLASLLLTLWDERTDAIINGRDHQNCLNTHNVTVDEEGVLEWQLTEVDTAILTPIVSGKPVKSEKRFALFEFSWIDEEMVVHRGRHELTLIVRNLAHTPP